MHRSVRNSILLSYWYMIFSGKPPPGINWNGTHKIIIPLHMVFIKTSSICHNFLYNIIILIRNHFIIMRFFWKIRGINWYQSFSNFGRFLINSLKTQLPPYFDQYTRHTFLWLSDPWYCQRRLVTSKAKNKCFKPGSIWFHRTCKISMVFPPSRQNTLHAIHSQWIVEESSCSL